MINSQTQGFQAIKDKLCRLELDSCKQKVSDQAAEIASLKGAVSQTANLIRAINPAPYRVIKSLILKYFLYRTCAELQLVLPIKVSHDVFIRLKQNLSYLCQRDED